MKVWLVATGVFDGRLLNVVVLSFLFGGWGVGGLSCRRILFAARICRNDLTMVGRQSCCKDTRKTIDTRGIFCTEK